MLTDKMKEISKENLLKIIQEESSQIAEMADTATIASLDDTRKQAGEGPRAKKRGSLPRQSKPLVAPGDDPSRPSVHVQNPFKVPGEQHVWVFIDKDSADHLLENKEWAGWFETKVLGKLLPIPTDDVTGEPVADYDWKQDKNRIFYGKATDLNLKDVNELGFNAPKWFRLNQQHQRDAYLAKTGKHFKDPEFEPGTMSPREKFLRHLYRILRGYFNSSEVVKHLNLSGLPIIKLPNQETADQKRGTDTYSTKENEDVTYRSTWYLPYETYLEFAEHSQDLLDLQGATPEEYESYEHKKGMNHARKFNTRREQWAYNRAQQKMPESFKAIALTPIHKNERGGYKATDQDFMVCNWFTVTGKIYDEEGGQKYRWEIDFKTEIGEKLRESSYAPLKADKEFGPIVSETPIIPTGIEIPEDGSVLDNSRVNGALNRACKELVNKILSYNPIDDLEDRVNKMRSDITKVSSLSESKVKLIVNDVLKQLKK